ncbi:dopamine receptor D4a [Brachyhypopomus gauderio]|uniref:dopamine receptor D4a n=1 Tax=Brachyhypopomus gauderio TaxID=698409 RepID=UPI004041F69F
MPANLSSSTEVSGTDYNFTALIFGIILIVVIICGNLLVCLSVYTEKALKTTTNYFIVSLAVADLLLAVLVLPLFVYAEFLDGVWTLNTTICDGLMTMDVMLCTASIFNLCAISIDRFIAVSVPLNYSRRHVDQRQAALLSATWVLALAVASPVLFGVNDVPNRRRDECKLEDSSYVVYSSVCSFFVPCPIMLLLYCGIFQSLRRWEEARKAKLKGGARPPPKLQLQPELPLPLSPPLPPLPPVIERKFTDINLVELDQDATDCKDGPVLSLTCPHGGYDPHRNHIQEKKTAKINGRERKAMRVLPVVVGVFLVCWTPFFVVHTTRALCDDCKIPSSLTSIVTWLGYVNSALNPIIYTVFNAEFRKFFRKFLPNLHA